MENPEFFGNEFQVALQEKCLNAWPALQNNPKINFSGRNFGWDEPALDDIDAIANLANTFGVVSTFATSQTILRPFIKNLKSRQLDVEIWQRFRSTDSSKKICASVLERANWEGYQSELIDQSTSAQEVREVQELMQSCGIAPLPGYVLRGKRLKSVAVVIKAVDNSIAATAIGVLRHHSKGPFRKAAHVGYLATKPEHRRQGLAKVALATVNQILIEKYGLELLHTGVKSDNAASKRTCEACGLYFDEETYLLAIFQKKISGEDQFTQ